MLLTQSQRSSVFGDVKPHRYRGGDKPGSVLILMPHSPHESPSTERFLPPLAERLQKDGIRVKVDRANDLPGRCAKGMEMMGSSSFPPYLEPRAIWALNTLLGLQDVVIRARTVSEELKTSTKASVLELHAYRDPEGGEQGSFYGINDFRILKGTKLLYQGFATILKDVLEVSREKLADCERDTETRDLYRAFSAVSGGLSLIDLSKELASLLRGLKPYAKRAHIIEIPGRETYTQEAFDQGIFERKPDYVLEVKTIPYFVKTYGYTLLEPTGQVTKEDIEAAARVLLIPPGK